MSPGVCRVYVLPQEIKPRLPPQPEVDKFDCNMGVADPWIKIVLHQNKNGHTGHFNLPRLLWVKKTWTLVELHQFVFDYFRHLFTKWYKEIAENGHSNRSHREPEFVWKGSKLNASTLHELFELNDLK